MSSAFTGKPSTHAEDASCCKCLFDTIHVCPAGWRFLVNFLLPPPMILTFLLVLPFPRNVRKGLLIFTSQVLNFTVCKNQQQPNFADCAAVHCTAHAWKLQQDMVSAGIHAACIVHPSDNAALLCLVCSGWFEVCAPGAGAVWCASHW